MKLLQSSVLLAPAAFLLAATVNAQAALPGLQDALQSVPRLSEFSSLYSTSQEAATIDDQFAQSGGRDFQVFAPVNSAPNPPDDLSQNPTLARRDKRGRIAIGYYISHAPSRRRKRNVRRNYKDYDYEETFDYPTGVRDTFLSDPEFVNLGRGVNQRIVSRSVGKEEIEISTGEGDTVRTTGTPIRFKYGVIYPVDDYFSPPVGLCETLGDKGLDTFLGAIVQENLVKKVETFPGITVFAPLNPTKHPVKAFIIFGTVAYSPDLKPGSSWKTASGADLTIKKGADGGLTVNGQKIVTSDAILTNGVAHFIDNRDDKDTYY